MKKLLDLIDIFFSKGEQRTVLAKKNVIQTFLIRIVSVPVSFILIPLTINYVNSESYGIWITISSIVGWMSFFDIGINNGLRNKLTESIAVGNISLSKKYVSTTYAILGIISISIFSIFFLSNFFLDWSYLLNSSSKLAEELSKVALIVVGYFCFKFVLSTINTILLAHQKPAASSFRVLIEQTSSLLIIFLLTKYTNGSLLNLALGLCVAPLVILFFFNISLFFGKLKKISPSLKYIDFSITKDLMGIGFKFFIIQIAGIIQFQMANFIIIQTYGPNEVTVYNIVFKYFSVLTMIMAILIAPIWSAVTDAFAKNDIKWIIKTEIQFRKVVFALSLVGLFMLFSSSYIYNFWLGKNIVSIPFSTSFCMYIFTVISLFGTIYCNILNGISALNVQYIASMFSPIIFMITAYCLIHFGFGVNAIIIASIVANFNAFLLAPLQYKRIFYKNQ